MQKATEAPEDSQAIESTPPVPAAAARNSDPKADEEKEDLCQCESSGSTMPPPTQVSGGRDKKESKKRKKNSEPKKMTTAEKEAKNEVQVEGNRLYGDYSALLEDEWLVELQDHNLLTIATMHPVYQHSFLVETFKSLVVKEASEELDDIPSKAIRESSVNDGQKFDEPDLESNIFLVQVEYGGGDGKSRAVFYLQKSDNVEQFVQCIKSAVRIGMEVLEDEANE